MAADILPALVSETDDMPVGDDPQDRLVPLSDLKPKWLPKPISKFTLLRYSLKGQMGIRLKTKMVCGVKCSKEIWLWEYINGVSGLRAGRGAGASSSIQPHVVRTTAGMKAADAKLKTLGL